MADPEKKPPLDAGQIEIWKKIVDVQQHFNDLELRIRNFALIVTGAFLGLGGYAIKDGGVFNAFGIEVSLAGLIVVSAIFPLLAFYFMDRLWYHRLLDGSVQAGIEAETALKALGYKVDLGSKISEKSPFILWFTKKSIHSKTKMDFFYLMLVLALLIVGGCLGFGISPQTLPAEPPEISNTDGDVSTDGTALSPDNLEAPNQTSVNEIGAISDSIATTEPDG
jgi:hypothetical protein